jgi:hypothetical protein
MKNRALGSSIELGVSEMRARWATVSVSVLVGIGAWATPASAATRCSKPGGTLAQNAAARVFTASSGGVRRVFGCAAGQKNARSLGRAGGEGVDTKHLALVGARIAYVLQSCSEGGCSASVLVYDLKKRTDVSAALAAPNDNTDQNVTDIVLTKQGTVAWISEERAAGTDPVTARYVAHRTPGKGIGIPATPVSTGVDIVPGTLALAGRILYWTQGTPKSALLP